MKKSEEVTKTKPFINKYNWERIHFLSKKKNDWRKIEKNNVTITPNVLYATKEKNRFCSRSKT